MALRAGPYFDESKVLRSGVETEESERRILDEFFNLDEEGDGLFAVDESVVVGEGKIHHGADFDLA